MKTFFVKLLQDERFCILIIAAVAFLITLPILIWGVPNGYDMPHHYQCALTYLDAIKSGDFYPSWTLDRNLGYGAMELRLYPPVSHYVLALFSLITNENWHLATWLTFTFWWILGSLGVYLWAREIVSPRFAMIAALIYAVMPYRLTQAYLVFFYGEVAGSAILPFCFAFLARIVCEQRKIKIENYGQVKNDLITLNVIGLSVSYAALILTHLPLTLIVSFALTIYGLANAKFDLKYCTSYFLRLAIAVFTGLAATSFFWMKVLQERAILAKTAVYEDIYLNYSLNFLLTPFQTYDSLSIGIYEVFTLVYDIILALTLLMVLPLALVALLRRNSLKNQATRSLWITFSLVIFITTIFSKPIWDNFSFIQEVQFPWRFLSIVSVFAPLIAAAGLPFIQKWFGNGKLRPFALILIGLFFIGASFSLSNAIRGAVYTVPSEVNPYVHTLEQEPGFKFWWTIWTRKEFINNSTEKVSVENRQVSIAEWQPTERVFVVESGKATDIYIATFYHPNWHATVNGIPTEIRPADDGGMIIPAPFQNAVVKLSFQETFEVRLAQLLSKVVWLLLLCFGAFWYIRKYQNSNQIRTQNSIKITTQDSIVKN